MRGEKIISSNIIENFHWFNLLICLINESQQFLIFIKVQTPLDYFESIRLDTYKNELKKDDFSLQKEKYNLISCNTQYDR